MNKKAVSKLLSIWWIAVLTIIGVGVVSGTLIFFSGQIDVRFAEAEILSMRLVDCLVTNGYINQGVIDGSLDIFTLCNLNKEILDSSDYYLKIGFYKEDSSELINESIFGNRVFETDCKISAAMILAKNYPKCSEKVTYGLSENKEIIRIKIITGSNQGFRLKEK